MNAFEQLRSGPENARSQLDRLRASVPGGPNADVLAAVESTQLMRSRLGQRMRQVAGNILAEAQANRGLRNDPRIQAVLRARLNEQQTDVVQRVVDGLSMASLGPTTTLDQMMTREFDTSNETYIESRARTTRDGDIDLVAWGTSPQRIDRDRQLLTSWRNNNLQGLPPDVLAGFDLLIQRLSALERADAVRLQSAEIERLQQNSMTERGFSYMGRMTVIVGATGLTLLSGFMMLNGGSFSPAIGLYAAAALAAAYPNMFFGAREQRALETAGATFRTPAYIFFQGRLPAAAFGVMVERAMDDDTASLIQNTIRRGTGSTPTDREITTLVDALLPATNQAVSPAAREQLRNAVRERPTSLLDLVATLRTSSGNDDGRQLVIDGARLGNPRQTMITNASDELRRNPGAGAVIRTPPSSAGALG